MVEVLVKKAFDYSASVTESVHLEVGVTADIREDLIPGLVDGGFIDAPAAIPKGKTAPAPTPATTHADDDKHTTRHR